MLLEEPFDKNIKTFSSLKLLEERIRDKIQEERKQIALAFDLPFEALINSNEEITLRFSRLNNTEIRELQESFIGN